MTRFAFPVFLTLAMASPAAAIKYQQVFDNVLVEGALYVADVMTFSGVISLANGETIDNATDDMIEFQGVSGTDDTDLRIDLDGTYPVINSPTDTSIGIAEALDVTEGVTLGGGYASTGCTFSTAGVAQCAGALTIDGAASITGAGGLTLGNTDSLHTDTDAVFDFTRNDAGIVSLTCSDNDATCAFTVLPGGAAAMVLGGASTTALTVTTDGTGTAEVALPAGSIDGTEVLDATLGSADIADSVQSVQLPLGSWIDCDTGLPLDVSGTDAEPDFTAINNAYLIAYDATGASVDTDKICNSFRVPADYASGGTMVARWSQAGATATNIEDWSCAVSINGAALGSFGSTAAANQTAIQTVTSTPAGTFAAGDSVGVVCSQEDAAADDHVYLHAIEFAYTGVR